MSGKLKNNKANYFEEVDEVFPKRIKDIDYNIKPEIDPRKIISDQLRKDIKIIAKNDSQKKLINSIKNNEITICKGKPGSGKTYLAVAYALSLLQKKENNYNKIYLTKSITPLKNENPGFLRGSLIEKIGPSMMSFFINFQKIIGKSALNILLESGIIELFPLAYIRGTTLDDCIILNDEVQNQDVINSKTMMSRIGSNCKLIMMGDTNQIDMINKNNSSLSYLVDMFKNIDKIGVVEMNPNDVSIRNPLIDIIEAKFDEFENNRKQIKNKITEENDENRN